MYSLIADNTFHNNEATCDCKKPKAVETTSEVVCYNCGIVLDRIYITMQNFGEIYEHSQSLGICSSHSNFCVEHTLDGFYKIQNYFEYYLSPMEIYRASKYVLYHAEKLLFSYPNKFEILAAVYLINLLKKRGVTIKKNQEREALSNLQTVKAWSPKVKGALFRSKKLLNTSAINYGTPSESITKTEQKSINNYKLVNFINKHKSRNKNKNIIDICQEFSNEHDERYKISPRSYYYRKKFGTRKPGPKGSKITTDIQESILELYNDEISYNKIKEEIGRRTFWSIMPSKATISRIVKEQSEILLGIENKY